MLDNILTTDQVAEVLGVTQRQVGYLLKTGSLEGKKLGPRTWLTTKEALERYREARKKEAAPALG